MSIDVSSNEEFFKDISDQITPLVPIKEVIYSEDLGINYNGYPLEGINTVAILDTLSENECRRFYKNKRYVLEIVVKEVE